MPLPTPAAPCTPSPALAAPRIGIFDSGIGGLSVLRAVQLKMPQAHCSYVADSQFTPWGVRPTAWVVARCGQLSACLLEQGTDLVLVACNTATTQAITALRRRWPARLFVGIEPGIKPAAAASRNGRVAVMATTGTLRSARLQQLVNDHARQVSVLRLPCPGLVEAIEAAHGDAHTLARLLDGIAATLQQAGVDTVVLGCTHYPLVADALQQRLGPGVRLVDTADAVARQVASLLPTLAGPANPSPGALQLMATGPVECLQQAARHWLALDCAVQRLALPDCEPEHALAQ